MNAIQLHLMFNHFPVIIPFVGLVIILLGFFLKNNQIKRIALFVFVLGAITSMVASSTGEQAEELIEEMNIADYDYIHEHEEIAEVYIPVHLAFGIISLTTLWLDWKKKPISNIFAMVCILGSIGIIAFGFQVAHTGGEIMHKEIRSVE